MNTTTLQTLMAAPGGPATRARSSGDATEDGGRFHDALATAERGSRRRESKEAAESPPSLAMLAQRLAGAIAAPEAKEEISSDPAADDLETREPETTPRESEPSAQSADVNALAILPVIATQHRVGASEEGDKGAARPVAATAPDPRIGLPAGEAPPAGAAVQAQAADAAISTAASRPERVTPREPAESRAISASSVPVQQPSAAEDGNPSAGPMPAGPDDGRDADPVTVVAVQSPERMTAGPRVEIAAAVSRTLASPRANSLPVTEATSPQIVDGQAEPAQPDAMPVEPASEPDPVGDKNAGSYGERKESHSRESSGRPDKDASPALRPVVKGEGVSPSGIEMTLASLPDTASGASKPGTTAASLLAPLSADPMVRSAISAAGGAPVGVPVSSGPRSLQIQLRPAELGSVTATLRMTDDRLSVEMTTENAEAYRQLSNDSDTIVNALRGLGLQVDQIVIQPPQPASAGAGRTEGVPMQAAPGRDDSFAQAGGSSGGNSEARGGNRSNEGDRNDGSARQTASIREDARSGRGLVI